MQPLLLFFISKLWGTEGLRATCKIEQLVRYGIFSEGVSCREGKIGISK